MFKKNSGYLSLGLGIILLAVGLVLLKTLSNPQGILLGLPYVCIGFGCGAFGHGLGEIINRRVLKNEPQLQKQLDIEKNDERNIAISNYAKARAFDSMLYIFGALMVAFALMNVDIWAVLLLAVAYLFIVGLFIFYLNKYHKEM